MDKLSLAKTKAEVSRILFEIWDPIGVSELIKEETDQAAIVQLRFEYSTYELHIVGMVMNAASEVEIAEELDRIARDSMGILQAGERAKNAAHELVALR